MPRIKEQIQRLTRLTRLELSPFPNDRTTPNIVPRASDQTEEPVLRESASVAGAGLSERLSGFLKGHLLPRMARL
jgi:hypothetical protein